MKAHVICGSPEFWLPETLDGLIIGVDRGALELVKREINVDVAIGDFDSVTSAEMEEIKKNVSELIKLPVEKDVTDCEAAIEHLVSLGYKAFVLYGVTGGRLDHQMAIQSMMLKYLKQDVLITVMDQKNKFFLLKPDKHLFSPCDYRYVSFFAMGEPVKGLTLDGVYYPLEQYDLALDDSLCVSNEPTASEVSIIFDSGYLLVVQSND